MPRRTYPGRLTRERWLKLSDGQRYLLAARRTPICWSCGAAAAKSHKSKYWSGGAMPSSRARAECPTITMSGSKRAPMLYAMEFDELIECAASVAIAVAGFAQREEHAK
jgi:hypothetical protein